MSGLTSSGFERKRLVDIKTDIEDKLKNIFGANIDISPQSGLGQFVGIMSEAQADQWQSQEDIYNSQYPSTSQGSQLSNVVMYNGIERHSASKSTVVAILGGTVGTIIPSGSQASVVDTGQIFETIEDVVITSGSEAVNMRSVTTGEIIALTGTLTVIETPIFGWTSITNNESAVVGTNKETDAQLRIRRELSTQALGNNLTDSLYGQLANLGGVEGVVVWDNKTEATAGGLPANQFGVSIIGGVDEEIAETGLPANQFGVSIIGGVDEEIAETIWKNTPQGIASYGDTTVYHTDIQGFSQPVMFTRAVDYPVYFRIDIETSSEFPITGIEDIKKAVADFGTENFKISDDVIMSKFYNPINTVPGVVSISLFMGVSSSPSGTSNLAVSNWEISRYNALWVEVNII